MRRPESISSSLIILFISTYAFTLANTQPSSDGSPGAAAAAAGVAASDAFSQDEGAVDRKFEDDHAESSVDEDDALKFIFPSDKRRIGSEFLGKRTIPNFHGFTFEKRKALGSEFLGKRMGKLGSEFLGKRNGNLQQQQQQQQHPEDYQFFYSNTPEDEDYNSVLSQKAAAAGIVPIHMQLQQYPTTSRYATATQQKEQQYYQPNQLIDDAAWMTKIQTLKRGLGSEFLGKRDTSRASTFNLINKWNRAFGPRLPIEHDRKRKLMGSEFLG